MERYVHTGVISNLFATRTYLKGQMNQRHLSFVFIKLNNSIVSGAKAESIELLRSVCINVYQSIFTSGILSLSHCIKN